MKRNKELSIILKDLLEQHITCEQMEKLMNEYSFDNIDNVFTNLYHYFSDSDIRLKNNDYKTMQNNELKKLIKYLNNKEYESANNITFLYET